MTTQEQLDKLTQIAAHSLESIQALERIAAANTDQIAKHDEQIAELRNVVASLARDWQAYLRQRPKQ
jgi:hypothetical protein